MFTSDSAKNTASTVATGRWYASVPRHWMNLVTTRSQPGSANQSSSWHEPPTCYVRWPVQLRRVYESTTARISRHQGWVAFGLLCHLNQTGAQPPDTRRPPVVPRRLFAVIRFSHLKTRADSTCVSKIRGFSETRPPLDATRGEADQFKSGKSIVTIISFRVENTFWCVNFA